MRLLKIKLNAVVLKLLPSTSALCIILWALFHYDVYLNPDWVMPRDNNLHFLPTFCYIVEFLKRVGSFPEWIYTAKGGVWMGALSTNYLFAMPHRWVGYALAVWGGVHPILAYKLALLFGTWLFLLGVALLVRELGFSRTESVYASLFAFFSAICLTFLHQEQALGTVFLIPFLGWSLLRARYERRYWMLFASLLGLGLNFHYPQILFVYGVILIAAGVASPNRTVLHDYRTALRSASPIFWLVLVLSFVMSGGPLFYSYSQYRDRLESPLRAQSETLTTSKYEDYERINRYVPSSLHPANLKLYVNFFGEERTQITELDDNALYMGLGIFWAMLAVVVLFVRRKIFLPFVVIALGLATTGTYTFFPMLFWAWAPGLSMFRQWYHFSTLLNLHLLFAMLIGMRIVSRRFNFYGKAVLYGVTLLVTLWGSHYVVERVRVSMFRPAPLLERRELFQYFESQVVLPKGVDGKRLELENAHGSEIHQYDDGNWLLPATGGLVKVPRAAIERGDRLRRSTPWVYLVVGMWFPLLGWIAFEMKRHYAGFSSGTLRSLSAAA